MLCPKCADETRVYATYVAADGTSVNRQRRCKACPHRFYTTEVIVNSDVAYKRGRSVSIQAGRDRRKAACQCDDKDPDNPCRACRKVPTP